MAAHFRVAGRLPHNGGMDPAAHDPHDHDRDPSAASEGTDSPGASGALERTLHAARARVLADLAASEVADARVVSLVEESVTRRRWWVEQWPEGAEFVPGLVAQDVQDGLLERYGRWPVCPVCATGEPHALVVEPELGPDPQWVCAEAGILVAPVGALDSVPGIR